MPLKLIPPGKRKGRKFWIARGRIGGKLREFSTETTDYRTAELLAAQFAARLLETPEPKQVRSFRDAALAYCAWRSSLAREIGEVNKLIAEIGAYPLADVTAAVLVAVANTLYPGHKASSRNRLVITPGSAILHYAADQGWCDYRRIKRFKEAAPETRALRPEAAAKLVKAAKDKMARTFLIFLFGQGLRVSDALALTWEMLDLQEGLMRVRVGKTDQWRWKALQPEVTVALGALPAKQREGRVWPWIDRHAVYRALKAPQTLSGVKFTPHMARHSLGTWLNLSGASLKTTMDILDHQDPKSSLRYQMTELPEQRAAYENMGNMVGRRKKPRKIK